VVELRGKRFIVGKNQRRPVKCLYDLGHSECLSRPSDAQQNLMFFAVRYAASELLDGACLISSGLVIKA
jgi:hypothetical protein